MKEDVPQTLVKSLHTRFQRDFVGLFSMPGREREREEGNEASFDSRYRIVHDDTMSQSNTPRDTPVR